MSDQPETDAALGMEYNGAEGHETGTVASIIAEMRDTWTDTTPSALLDLADRIEAAYKREHAEWHAETEAAKEARNRIACKMRYEFSAKCRACKAAPCNAAVMREALEWAAQFLELGVDDDLGADGQNLTTAAEMARAALSATARNCDRFADCNSAWKAYNEIANRERLPGFDFWLFAPAEGGDHA